MSEINQRNVPDSVNSKYSVLVVEDDEGLNKLVCRRLEKEGFNIKSALKASDALDIIYENPQVLLLLDYRLPDMSGKTLVETLREKQYDVPFIVMTGFGDQKLAVDMMKMGARDYLVKDTDFIEFLPNVVNRAIQEMDTRRMLREAQKEKGILEQQLRQAQKMEAIGVLAGGVAHDFNNLLTAIHGYSTLAISEVDEDSTLYSKLLQVQRAAERAATLTRQLLLFSRKQAIQQKPVDISATVDDMIKMLQRLIGEDIRVIPRLDPDIWITMADVGNIEQVIMNLAVNARDAMPEGGSITFTAKNTVISDTDTLFIPNARSGKYVCLTVSDKGTGMNEETVQRIFEPFYTTKEEGKGTGLGLSVVYGIISQHNGFINVFSEIGIGTTFDIYLPASDTATKEKADKKLLTPDYRGKGEHILVVEDDDDMREWVVLVLRERGYIVSEAENAEDARTIFRDKPDEIALVISDVIMPGESGIKLAEEFISIKPEIKVILSSGYSGEKSNVEKIKDRGIPFLDKPFTMVKLLGTVKEVLEEK